LSYVIIIFSFDLFVNLLFLVPQFILGSIASFMDANARPISMFRRGSSLQLTTKEIDFSRFAVISYPTYSRPNMQSVAPALDVAAVSSPASSSPAHSISPRADAAAPNPAGMQWNNESLHLDSNSKNLLCVGDLSLPVIPASVAGTAPSASSSSRRLTGSGFSGGTGVFADSFVCENGQQMGTLAIILAPLVCKPLRPKH
jgi:hypothetical protein